MALACCQRGNGHLVGYAGRLTNPFVVREEEGAILQDRAADCSAKLIALEGWNAGRVEVVGCIQRAVAQEFVCGSMKRICSGTCNRTDDTRGGAAVLGRIVRSQYREFFDSIDSESAADDTARTAIGIVVQADSIQAVAILLGAPSRDAELRTETAIASTGSCSVGVLCFDGHYSGL